MLRKRQQGFMRHNPVGLTAHAAQLFNQFFATHQTCSSSDCTRSHARPLRRQPNHTHRSVHQHYATHQPGVCQPTKHVEVLQQVVRLVLGQLLGLARLHKLVRVPASWGMGGGAWC